MHLTPAAQYLRMSTEHQQYSLENQASAIATYAADHGFEVIRTYTDAGKSGLVVARRHALQDLLRDVITGAATYKAILVYDVSRWGRFQDIDESAHHEYICRYAGIPVHYCAEPFTNDNDLANMIMKALKRMMAGEYSRELSVKVRAGAIRLVKLGFKQGGIAGFGYRRMLISPTGEPKQELLTGERKAVQEDRVVLAPGPAYEVYWVREIFRMFTEDRKDPLAIATQLNATGVRYCGLKRQHWYPQAVNRLLRNHKYMGCNVYGRVTQRLHTPRTRLPESMWTVIPGAWEGIIDPGTFKAAQERFANQVMFRSNEQLISELAALLRAKGKLSAELLRSELNFPSGQAYVKRFGSMSEAFVLAGYAEARTGHMHTRRVRRVLREQLIDEIIAASCGKISIVQPDLHHRVRLRLPNRVLVSIYLCPFTRSGAGERWILSAWPPERRYVTLIVRLDERDEGFHDFFVLPNLLGCTQWTIKPNDMGLQRGKQLTSLGDLITVVDEVRRRNKNKD